MNICICTTPIRPQPTYFPPFGSLAIIQALRRIGEQAAFFNIDYHRPTTAEVEEYFSENQFDIVGISAVVSTAYAYTQLLARLIRRVSPKTIIILGGNLAASAEILLRKCNVDYCVVGYGEIIIRELVTTLREHGKSPERLKTVKGICLLDDSDKFCFTGYGVKPAAEEIEDPDYAILEVDGSLEHYIPEVSDDRFICANRTVKFSGGRVATVTMTKGCVARCTFCHRWEKGYQVLPASSVEAHLKLLMERYDVGYVDIADENFGSDRAQANELASLMGRLGIVWRAGGVRSSTVSPEQLRHWKENGCIAVVYGTESGSQTMLDVMEKKTSIKQNIDALRWTYEAGMRSVLQLVIGMPGETDKTILESISFLNVVVEFLYLGDDMPSSMISLNYAQALPGTPLYEYARQHGFVGRTIEDEEQYLLKISDTDAYAEDHFINYTGLPLLKVLMWRQKILAEVDAHYLMRKYDARFSLAQITGFYYKLVASRLSRTLKKYLPPNSRLDQSFASEETEKDLRDFTRKSGYYNIRDAGRFTPLLLNPITKAFFTPLLVVGVAFGKHRTGWGTGLRLLLEYCSWGLKRSFLEIPDPALPKMSLRKVVQIVPSNDDPTDDGMLALRKGR